MGTLDIDVNTHLIDFGQIFYDAPASIYRTITPGETQSVLCISDDSARVGWHFTNGLPVPDAVPDMVTEGDFKQIRTGGSVIPSMSRLSLNSRSVTNQSNLVNGLWSCRLNGIGGGNNDPTGGTFEDQVLIAIFESGEVYRNHC